MTTKPCKCRFDAAGHRVLPHPEMLLYYQNDPVSLNRVRSWMPHKYIVVPIVEIHIHLGKEVTIQVYKIYPGETQHEFYNASVRALEGLRATFSGKKKGWTVTNKNGLVVLRREGRVIMDPKKRYGVW